MILLRQNSAEFYKKNYEKEKKNLSFFLFITSLTIKVKEHFKLFFCLKKFCSV